jgi:hypothetical protein
MAKRVQFSKGQRIHIDVDDKQWGRVATDATILEIRSGYLLVSAESIHANIIIAKREAHPVII